MSSRLLIRQLVEERMALNFSDLPVKYENSVFNQPADGWWVDFCVEPHLTKVRAIGRGLTRTPGIVKATVHFPVGIGMGDGWEVADRIGSIFDSQTLKRLNSYLKFKCASAESAGRVDSSYSIVVTVPFWFDGDDR